MNGWIKIHRTMLEWEHFNEPSVVTVFLALLLNADKEGKTGITIGGIASVTKLHHNTVKRAIAKLSSVKTPQEDLHHSAACFSRWQRNRTIPPCAMGTLVTQYVHRPQSAEL